MREAILSSRIYKKKGGEEEGRDGWKKCPEWVGE